LTWRRYQGHGANNEPLRRPQREMDTFDHLVDELVQQQARYLETTAVDV
jgi:hypothetical protein